jgi:hypothetical protein
MLSLCPRGPLRCENWKHIETRLPDCLILWFNFLPPRTLSNERPLHPSLPEHHSCLIVCKFKWTLIVQDALKSYNALQPVYRTPLTLCHAVTPSVGSRSVRHLRLVRMPVISIRQHPELRDLLTQFLGDFPTSVPKDATWAVCNRASTIDHLVMTNIAT